MKIQIKTEYPPEITTIIEDYNKAIDQKDISDVDLAVTGLITNVLSPNQEFRKAAIDCLSQVANVQPGFLKNAVRVLISKYKQGGEKGEFASIALAKVILQTKAKPLLTETDLIQKITEEENTRTASQRAERQLETKFLEKVKTIGIDLSGLSGSVFQVGNYYKKCLVEDNFQAASDAVVKLIDETIASYPENFIQACILLGRIGNEANRKEFFKKNLNYLREKAGSRKKEERAIAEEILESIISDVVDLLPADDAGRIQAETAKKAERRKKETTEKAQREKAISKGSIEIDFKWNVSVRDVANAYNDALAANNDKGKNAAVANLEKLLADKEEQVRLDGAQMFRQLFTKNKDIVQKIFDHLLKTCQKSDSSEILGELLDLLGSTQACSADTLHLLSEDKKVRDTEREKRRLEDQKKFAEIERVSIKFDSQWEEKLVKLCEGFNTFIMDKKEKDAQKIVSDIDKYMYAEDKEIRRQATIALLNVSEKYPDYIAESLKKLASLFDSQHEHREIASENLALLLQSVNKDQLFKDVKKDLVNKIYTEQEERIKKADDQALQDKWQSIRMDVVPVQIKQAWPKNIQDLVRRYNEGIKNQDKEKVQAEIKTVVDRVMNERKEELLTQWIEVLGGIAEKNIELISPTITLLLQWAGEKDENKKFRAIQGLGEVAVARPGWAYQAIETLFKIIKSDENQKARIKSFIEVRRIAKKEATMLIEYGEDTINALKDGNKDIRLQAAMTLGQMGEIIPTELADAIPALTDALHDDYPLVRTFADKTLTVIRQAMRK